MRFNSFAIVDEFIMSLVDPVYLMLDWTLQPVANWNRHTGVNAPNSVQTVQRMLDTHLLVSVDDANVLLGIMLEQYAGLSGHK
jgi:hypothetical protein